MTIAHDSPFTRRGLWGKSIGRALVVPPHRVNRRLHLRTVKQRAPTPFQKDTERDARGILQRHKEVLTRIPCWQRQGSLVDNVAAVVKGIVLFPPANFRDIHPTLSPFIWQSSWPSYWDAHFQTRALHLCSRWANNYLILWNVGYTVANKYIFVCLMNAMRQSHAMSSLWQQEGESSFINFMIDSYAVQQLIECYLLLLKFSYSSVVATVCIIGLN